MEIKPSEPIDSFVDQLTDLLQRFIRRRPNLILPEHVVKFKQEMVGLKSGKSDISEDYPFIIRIFVNLAGRKMPPTMGELSEDLNVPLSTATRIVDWLVMGKFVERIPDPADRRVVRVRMSEIGKRHFEASIDFIRQRLALLLTTFTIEEQTELVRLFGKLIDALEQEK